MATKDFKEKDSLGVEVEKMEEIQEPTVKKDVLMDFDKAFRIFKKSNPNAKKWDAESVLVFTKKKNSNKLNSLDSWVEIFKKY